MPIPVDNDVSEVAAQAADDGAQPPNVRVIPFAQS